MSKLLLTHLRNSKDLLLSYSDAIGIADHKVNLGSAREALIANFLSQNLPKAINYETGELFDCDGNRSGQIDILLTPNSSPRLHLYGAINLLPVDTTLAAIEVKSNLTTGEKSSLQDALKNCYKAKDLNKINRGEMPIKSGKICLATVPYLVFAYKGAEASTILDSIKTRLESDKISFKHTPDMIVVLEKGYYLVKNIGWKYAGASVDTVYQKRESNDHVLLGIYEFLVGAVEYWSENLSQFRMPLDRYTKDIPSVLDLF